jgi:hypothetical protein
MIHILFAAFMLTATPEDTIPPTQEPKDTLKKGELMVPGRKLKEVEVVAPKSTSGLEDALRQSLERMGIRNPITMSTVLDKIKPGLNDYIMHPFGFKERRQAKKYKKTKKILDDFDKVKTFDELVREALEREGITLPPREEKTESK